MKNGWKHSIMAMTLLMGSVLITACADDAPESDNGDTLKMSSCFTRSSGGTWEDGTTVELFVTTGSKAQRRQITYSEDVSGWVSNATVKTGENYCLYGYMPAKTTYETTISAFTSEGHYNDGASLTIKGLNPVTTDEVCFVIGVKEGTAANAEDITEKRYSYIGKPKGENSVSLLMSPLYAGVKFNIKVNSEYEALRTIKLKEMSLETGTGNQAKDITITQSNSTNSPEVNFTWKNSEESSTSTTAILFENTDGIELSSTVALEVKEGYFLANLSSLTLVSTYDVYDKSGNLTRKNCEARNDLMSLVKLERGTKTNIALTVDPTYLHVLSDSDLPPFVAKVEQ